VIISILQTILFLSMIAVCPMLLYVACVRLKTETVGDKLFVGAVIVLTLAAEVILYSSFTMLSTI